MHKCLFPGCDFTNIRRDNLIRHMEKSKKHNGLIRCECGKILAISSLEVHKKNSCIISKTINESQEQTGSGERIKLNLNTTIFVTKKTDGTFDIVPSVIKCGAFAFTISPVDIASADVVSSDPGE